MIRLPPWPVLVIAAIVAVVWFLIDGMKRHPGNGAGRHQEKPSGARYK